MAEMVAGAFLSSFLNVVFDRLTSRQVVEFFRERKVDEELCENLKMMLQSMDPFVAYAELKQISDERVRIWLGAVREVVLNAEDLLDEIDIQITQNQLETQSIYSRVRNHLKASPLKSIMKSMEKVLAKLKGLQDQTDKLDLKNATGASVASVVKRVESTSHGEDMYGRDDDKERIVDWLTSPTEKGNKVSIISIVGMGGLGKTTLAQHVYQTVKDRFDVHAWVCVSDDFDVIKLTNAVLVAITKSTADYNWQQLDLVHERFKEALTGKKFLLVLDDVWNQKPDQWEALQTPLKYGATGSKILVTTRIKKVAASCMRSDKIHDLGELQEDHCWEILVKHAFSDENPQVDPELKKIGLQIVKKCKGLPLALKTIGSLLYGKLSVSEWESVVKSEIWQFPEDHNGIIIPALLLSYYHLPSLLKRCFAFCALFPKDFKFDRDELILLWMGENYLQCYNQNKSMEEVGKEYFDDLLSRSFFQKSSEDAECYVMHDLLHDLAKYVSGDVCFTLKYREPKSIPEKTRHFSFETCLFFDFEGFEGLDKASRLRTFLPLRYDKWVYGAPISDLFSKCRFLRVMSLSDNGDLTEVPNSVGNLKHLRSLDLSHARIKKLPNSTCSLFNLQILKLQHCRSLEELPRDLHKLIKLHHLDLRETGLRKLPDSTCSLFNLEILKLQGCQTLKELPRDLHKLVKLHHLDLRQTGLRKLPMHLTNLQVTINSLCMDREFKIQHLGGVNLRGNLHISGIETIVNSSDALAANFKSKMYLAKLKLEWSEKHDVSEQEKEVLENLQPSKHLEKLTIENYGGTEFPLWFGDGSLSNLVSLKLSNCENCKSLPLLGQLPSLKKLSINGLPEIVAIGEEFHGSPSSSFASLEILEFQNMKEWKKWECKAVTGAFPKLQKLSIKNCPKLEESLPEQFPCLEEVTIDGCKELGRKIGQKIEERMETMSSDGECMEVSSVDYYFPNPIHHYYNSLVYLTIKNCSGSPTTFPLDFFPNLRFLYLGECDNLQMISQDQPHNHLGQLYIDGCSQFESFPSKGLSAPELYIFKILGSENLKTLPKQMDTLLPCLTELGIKYCPEVELISDERLPSNLKKLDLDSCSKLMRSLKGALGGNTSIERLYIHGMDMECFPDESFLPPSLTFLHIHNCGNLKRLDYKGLCHLSSLTELRLSSCPSIECLPEEGLPKSISSLYIDDCWLLAKHWQKLNGESWEEIVHI